MPRFETPKKAIGFGFNTATFPLRSTRWAAGLTIRGVNNAYHRQTVAGKELADTLQLKEPAHNAEIGAEALSKVPIVEELLDEAGREVQKLTDMGAEPIKIEAAMRERRKLVQDIKILKETAYGMIGKSLRQVIHNDIPPHVDADVFPPDVAATVLDVAVESKVKPDKLPLPGLDKEVIALRLSKHKEFM